VKRFVYTSSSIATKQMAPGLTGHIGRDSWNEEAVKLAWAPPPYEAERGVVVYCASKTEAEQAVWTFVEENEVGFTVNVVGPYTTLGTLLDKSHEAGVPGWVLKLWEGDATEFSYLKAGEFASPLYGNFDMLLTRTQRITSTSEMWH
jgi:nucleoside-diphosphate-sugar epimerase